MTPFDRFVFGCGYVALITWGCVFGWLTVAMFFFWRDERRRKKERQRGASR